MRSQPDKFKTWVLEHHEALRTPMMLTNWRYRIKFDEELNPDVVANCCSFPDYMEYEIKLSKYGRELFDKGELATVHESIIHELVHVILWDLQRNAEDACARVSQSFMTTCIERTTVHFSLVLSALLTHYKPLASEYKL